MNNFIKKILATIILLVIDLAILVIAVFFGTMLHYPLEDLIAIVKEKGLAREGYALLYLLLTIIFLPPYMKFNYWLIKKLTELFEIHDWQ